MAETKLNETFQQIKMLIIEMPLMKKLSIIVAVGVSISVLVVLGQISKQTGYQTLFSDLKSEDLSAVATALDKYGIPYEVQSATQSILVPGDKVLETRLKLARDGLPKFGSVGFEIFDEKTFGMTDFEQRLNYQRALQGELIRTINELKEVDDCRVHLVIPEKNVFSQTKDTPTASIVLKLAQGEKVQEETVRSIVHLVSASIPNMNAKDVTVVDTSGKLLTAEGGDEAGGGMASFRKKHDVEQTYEEKVRALLEPIVGFGKVKVQVTADLDFTTKETTEEKFDPESVAVRSESRSKNKESGGSSATGTTTAEGAASKNKDESTESISYEISKQVQKIVDPVGELKVLSVAVLVDGVYTANADGTSAYAPRTPEELKNYEDIVKSAIGFNDKRGDQLKVMNLAFQNPETLFATSSGALMTDKSTYAFYISMIINVVIALIALLLIFFVVRPLIVAWNARKDITAEGVGALQGGQQLLLQPGIAKGDLQGKATNDPENMVQVLKKWLE